MNNNDDPFNGPFGREMTAGQDHIEESVYCVECGTIYVPAQARSCPACTLAELIEERGEL